MSKKGREGVYTSQVTWADRFEKGSCLALSLLPPWWRVVKALSDDAQVSLATRRKRSLSRPQSQSHVPVTHEHQFLSLHYRLEVGQKWDKHPLPSVSVSLDSLERRPPRCHFLLGKTAGHCAAWEAVYCSIMCKSKLSTFQMSSHRRVRIERATLLWSHLQWENQPAEPAMLQFNWKVL